MLGFAVLCPIYACSGRVKDAHPRIEHACGVRSQQHRDHHGQIRRLAARFVTGMPGVAWKKSAIDCVVDESCQVLIIKPCLKRLGLQHLRLWAKRQIVGRVKNLVARIHSECLASLTLGICRADSGLL